jgi:hypothetical protein
MLNTEKWTTEGDIPRRGKIEKVSTRQFGSWTIPENQGK